MITAFDKSKPKHEKRRTSSSETLTTPSTNHEADGVTLPSNEVSSKDKGTNKSEASQVGEGYSISPSEYVTKRGKVLDMHLVKFDEELSKEVREMGVRLAKKLNGWYDWKRGGFMMRTEEDAKRVADRMMEYAKEDRAKVEDAAREEDGVPSSKVEEKAKGGVDGWSAKDMALYDRIVGTVGDVRIGAYIDAVGKGDVKEMRKWGDYIRDVIRSEFEGKTEEANAWAREVFFPNLMGGEKKSEVKKGEEKTSKDEALKGFVKDFGDRDKIGKLLMEEAKRREGVKGNNDNNKEKNDEEVQLRVGSGEGERKGGKKRGPSKPMGEKAGGKDEGLDDGGMVGRGDERAELDERGGGGVSVEPHGGEDVVGERKRNERNNHGERGVDYAPKGVDARIKANMEAIRLAKELEESGRVATREEMEVLRRFSGWGGLGKLFNADTWDWKNTQMIKELKGLLGEDGYKEAALSANSSYYTPAGVIDAMWDIARLLGFKGGRVLEGSAGIGNILGQMPRDMSERSDIDAVELDGTTGGLLRLLYPDAKVRVMGFEDARVENGSVDLAITNVPFVTGLNVMDKSGDRDLSDRFANVTDFCIAKNVRKLREGGLAVLITSSGTMDNANRLREWIVSEGGADFVGAFRLNNKTFGGTGATSDILVIRKRVGGQVSANAIDVSRVGVARMVELWVKTGKGGDEKLKNVPLMYNEYFMAHPEMMGGEMFLGGEKGDNYRPTSAGLYPNEVGQEEVLKRFVDGFKGMKEEAKAVETPEERSKRVYEGLGEGVKEGSLMVDKEGRVCVASMGRAVPLMSVGKKGDEVSEEELVKRYQEKKVKGRTKAECLAAYEEIKKALGDVLAYEAERDDDKGLKPLIEKLNGAYDGFVKVYGHFHNNSQLAFLRRDVDFGSVLALETYSVKGQRDGKKVEEFGKSDVFGGRVLKMEKRQTPKDVKDGIITSMYVNGKVDLGYISKALGREEEDVKREMVERGLGYEDPVTREMEVSYRYLSGNVRDKLRMAKEQNRDGRYDANVRALERVMPETIPAHLINFSLGSQWLDKGLYEEYIEDRTGVKVGLMYVDGTWVMKELSNGEVEKNRGFGVWSEDLQSYFLGSDLIKAAMMNKSVQARKVVRGRVYMDKKATEDIAAKVAEIRQDFRDWAQERVASDGALAKEIEKRYNEKFNNYVPLDIPSEFAPKRYAGMAESIGGGRRFELREHQTKAVVKCVTQPTLLAHEVGSGKTFTLITSAMEMRRLGTAKKPMIVVQNATAGQFAEEAKRLYPNAKILTIDDNERSAEGRRNFYAKIRYNDWDMVIIPQSVLDMIPDSRERQMRFIQDRIEEKKETLARLKGNGPEVREATGRIEREIEKLKDDLADVAEEVTEGKGKRTSSSRGMKEDAKTEQNVRVEVEKMLDRRTDDVETFDDMGVDALLVDEAHAYKHLGFSTAMQRGVKGVDPSYSKRSQSVFLKCQAVKERNNGRNVVFATGTPISNTAAEMWTFMRYLMSEERLKSYGIYYFDDFVRNFGNIEQMGEFTTSGQWKEVNRFSGYTNMPELARIWSEVADSVLSADSPEVLKKLPEMEGGKPVDVYLPQTKALRGVMRYVKGELMRYEQMSGKEKKRNTHIPLTMYGIANAAAVDPRLVLDGAADEPMSKTNEAVRETLRSLKASEGYRGTVAIFSDKFQNKRSGFNLFDEIKRKLVEAGVPDGEIVVMRDGMSQKKLEVFDKVNRGDVRVILGSTQRLGVGVNIQERLHTLIHLDAPNRPMDYTQRNGRILRQGNLHKEWGVPVRVVRMGVEDSLDVTAYQRLKTKGRMADSVMRSREYLKDAMSNRVLEEEGDEFGDVVANLSGSQYALLKQQAERELRKYESRERQWEQDQRYIGMRKPELVAEWKKDVEIERANREAAERVKELFPEGRVKVIKVGRRTYGSVEEMGELIKEFNKSVREDQAAVRDSELRDTRRRVLTVDMDGVKFVVTALSTTEIEGRGGLMRKNASTTMTYGCEELGLKNVAVYQSLLRNALEDMRDSVVTGKDYRENAERFGDKAEGVKRELDLLEKREGKPFEYAKELERARAHVEEYTELMKKELEEKEKKYAEVDKDVEEIDASELNVDGAEDDGDGVEDALLRGGEARGENVDVLLGELKGKRGDERSEVLDALGEEVRGYAREMGYGEVEVNRTNEDLINNTSENSKEIVKDFIEKGGKVPAQFKNGRIFVNLEQLENAKLLDYALFHEAAHKYIEENPIVLEAVREYLKQGTFDREDLEEVLSVASNSDLYKIEASTKKEEEVIDFLANEALAHLAQKMYEGRSPYVFTAEYKLISIAKEIQNEVINERRRTINGDIARRNENVGGNAERGLSDYERLAEGEPRDERIGGSGQGYGANKERERRVRKALVRIHDGWRQQVGDVASSLGMGDAVRVVESADEVEGVTQGMRGAKGWYDTKTGKVVVVLDRHRSVEDVMRTVLHEVVGHYGLRRMVGREGMNALMDGVFDRLDEETRKRVAREAKGHGWDVRVATEEYLASLAEDGGFEEARRRGVWERVKGLVGDVLRGLGWKRGTLDDRELRYLLWRSYVGLRRGEGRGLLDRAEDVALQWRLGVGMFRRERPLTVGEMRNVEESVLYREDRERVMARDF